MRRQNARESILPSERQGHGRGRARIGIGIPDHPTPLTGPSGSVSGRGSRGARGTGHGARGTGYGVVRAEVLLPLAPLLPSARCWALRGGGYPLRRGRVDCGIIYSCGGPNRGRLAPEETGKVARLGCTVPFFFSASQTTTTPGTTEFSTCVNVEGVTVGRSAGRPPTHFSRPAGDWRKTQES